MKEISQDVSLFKVCTGKLGWVVCYFLGAFVTLVAWIGGTYLVCFLIPCGLFKLLSLLFRVLYEFPKILNLF
jgi:hypothetical protein